MSTQTGSQIYPRNNAIRANHVGLHVATGNAVFAVTGTASSVYLLCRVPHGALIHDIMFNGDDGGADNTWDIGLVLPEGTASYTLTQSALQTTLSLSANTAPHRGVVTKLPYAVDCPDAHPQQWAWVCATAAVAVSASISIKISVFYTMEDTTP